QTQLQWNRVQKLLVFNTVALPFIADTDRSELIKFVLSIIGLCVHIALVAATFRGTIWVDYWNDRLADLERLDSKESDPGGVRVKVFTHHDFDYIRTNGVTLKNRFLWVGAAFGFLWFVISIYCLYQL